MNRRMSWEGYDREMRPVLILWRGRLNWLYGSRKRVFHRYRAGGSSKSSPVLSRKWMREWTRELKQKREGREAA